MNIRIDTKLTITILFSIFSVLVFSHFLIVVATFKLGFNNEVLFDYVNLDDEENLPTFFSGFLLLFCSLLLFIISAYQRNEGNKDYKYWLGLGFIFLFLAIDESSKIHEKVIDVYWAFFAMHENEKTDNYIWVIAYGAFALVVAALYFRFVLSQPKKTCILMFFSGGLYVLGALGMEVIGALYVDQSWFRMSESFDYSRYTGRYYLISGTEETFEMLGAIIFIYTLLSYIEAKWQGLYIFSPLPGINKHSNEQPQ